MGIESDQLVFDYLSRVGDLAQQRQLPSGDRMRLVTELRNEIDRRRAKVTTGDSPAAVRRILARLGTPGEVVTAAGTAHDAATGAPWVADPVTCGDRRGRNRGAGAGNRAGESVRRGGGGPHGAAGRAARRGGDRVRPGQVTAAEGLAPDNAPAPVPSSRRRRRHPGSRTGEGDRARPLPAPSREHGRARPTGSQPDWWRNDAGPLGGPDMRARVRRRRGDPRDTAAPRSGRPGRGRRGRRRHGRKPAPGTRQAATRCSEAADGAGTPAPARPARLLSLLRRRPPRPPLPRLRRSEQAKSRRTWSNPLLLLAAALLVAGVVLGHWSPWPRLVHRVRLPAADPRRVKWAVLGLPGVALAAGVVWLWGRQTAAGASRSPRAT